jgi:cell division protein FtsW
MLGIKKSAKGKKKEASKFRVNADLDYKLIASVILLAGFGLVVLYSSSYYSQGLSMVIKQAVVTILGLAIMILPADIGFDYHRVKKYAVLLFLISLGLTVAVITPLGLEINGARRWLNLKVTTFQPAECVKLAMIILLAGILSTYWNKLNKLSMTVILIFVMLIPVGFTFLFTDNLSSAIIMLVIGFGMVYLAHPNDRLWLLFLALGLLAAVALIYYIVVVKKYVDGESFRYTRIRIWMDPFNTEYEKGYQTRQGLYALSTGGLFGRGLGNSILKQGYLPEPYNDMIFAVLCEEMGLFGAAMVLYLFLYLIIRIFRIAISAPDKFGFLICMGVMIHIASQVILNVLVVTNTIMNTGITLCFFSGGGSSLLFLYAEIGLVLSVAKRIQNPKL